MKDVVDMYLKDARAKPYRDEDLAINNGHLPQKTVLEQHVCFCLIKPTYDQCADPIYTQLRANLSTWHKLRAVWHEKESKCGGSTCACSSTTWFRSITSSEAALVEGTLCKPVKCPELTLEEDNGAAPELHKPCCTGGECTEVDCLASKLALLRDCLTEFADSTEKVRYRKYVKMLRFRNDGSEYYETEFVFVEESRKEFVATMLSSIEAYLAHRGAHHWAVRQRKVVIEKLKHAPSLDELRVEQSTTTPLEQRNYITLEEKMRLLRSSQHVQHLKITDHDIIIFTDFAARVKYENFFNETCAKPNQGTLCIAVVLHSPALRPVKKDVTNKTFSASAGLEDVHVSDSRKAPVVVQQGKRQMETVMEQTLLCDVFAGYCEESGDARFDQTLMRDIVAYYKFGHLVHATAATHRGEPIPIGKSLATAKTSTYDEERLQRREAFLAAQAREKKADALVQQQKESEAAASSSAPPEESGSKTGKVHRQRATAGKSKATPSADGPEVTVVEVDTCRRGKLTYMRLLLKWTDGCGVQYVQREAALGTAALYGDIEALAKEMAIDEAAKSGVIGTHVVFEPHCFKYIHDAAGKVFVDNKNTGVMGREQTISDIEQHYDHNAATMLAPVTEDFNFDFSFSNYIHVLYKKDDFINLEADAVEGIKSWRFTQGGTDERAAARGGHGTGGLGYSLRTQSHVCFCEGSPCKHVNFTGAEHGRGDERKVHACTQEKTDREQATAFVDTIKEGTPLASKGDLEDATAGGEPLWLSIAEGEVKKNAAPFKDASGRTIARHWAYVDVKYLVKIKTDAQGNVHYEEWKQPKGERTVLTKPKILTVGFTFMDVQERRNAATRYILSAANYARLTDVVRPPQ